MFRNTKCLLFEATHPIWGQSDHLVAQKIGKTVKKCIFSYNMGFPIYFAIYPLTLSYVKSQPFGVGRSLSPFWKLET